MAERLFTWVTEAPGARVGDAVAEIAADPRNNPLIPFGQLPMVHFASITIVEPHEGQPQPTLIFESNVDEPVGDYLTKLVEVGRAGLDRLYEGVPGYAPSSNDDVVTFLERHIQEAQLYHLGHPNRTVRELRSDFELRRSIAHELAVNADAYRDRSPEEILAGVRSKAKAPSARLGERHPHHPSWDVEQIGPPAPLAELTWTRGKMSWDRTGWFLFLAFVAWAAGVSSVVVLGRLLFVPRQVTIVLGAAVLFGLVSKSSADAKALRGLVAAVLIGFLVDLFFALSGIVATRPPLWLFVLASIVFAPMVVILVSYLHVARRIEVTKLPPMDAETRERVRRLLEVEDDTATHSIYNHVVGLSPLRGNGSRWRRIRTRLALFVLNLFYRTQFVKGRLVSITSIHFAQWRLVNTRYLLFITNYEGSADSYLDDFFNSLATGVAFIWHDTEPFPRTTDTRALKTWVRKNQTLARVRYRAPIYQGLTVGLINSNTFIRKGLLRGRGKKHARRWLRRLATTPVEPSGFSRVSDVLKHLAGVTG